MKNIFLIPTDKPSKLIYNENGRLVLGDSEYTITENKQYMYLTSDEDIVKGDWCLLQKDNKTFVYKCSEPPINPKDWGLKITLTTNEELISEGIQEIQIEFLQWFIKNSDCKFVEIAKSVTIDHWRFPFLEYTIHLPFRENLGYVTKSGIEVPDEFVRSVMIPKEYFGEEVKKTERKRNFYCGDKVDHDEQCQQQCEGCNDATGVDYGYLENDELEDVVEWSVLENSGLDKPFELIDSNDISRKETLEEASCKEMFITDKVAFIRGAKWQEKISYTEEEVRNLFNRYNEMISHRDISEWQPWIDKQFKK